MKPIVTAYALLAAILCNPAVVVSQPNVVLIMVDDMGYNELGVTGQLERAAQGLNHIQTPQIDFLAQNGLQLTNFYATPICASSRSALMTGFHNGHSSVDRNGGNNGGNAIRNVDYTIGELFQQSGYRTGQFGKWGLGGFDHNVSGMGLQNPAAAVINFPNAIPTVQGFHEYYGYLNQVRAHTYYQQYQWEQDGLGGLQIHLTNNQDYSHDLIADRALEFISTNYQSPFFLYLPFTIPHSDFDPPQDSIFNGFIADGYSVAQANYAAMMKRLDNSVADIVARLQDPNLDGSSEDSVLENTVIMFCSDNGGTNQNSLFDGGGNLRGQKGSVHEGGIATPLIVYWDGNIEPGQINTTRVGGIDDLLPTCADLIGVRSPLGCDGGSLADLISDQLVVDVRPYHVFEARNNNDWAIRFDEWKLSKAGNNLIRLYNLEDNRSETNDLSGTFPDIASLLQQIALSEGVESDSGSGVTQTTNIVQYKSWIPATGSSDFAAADNWQGGTEFNTRGTAANNFATGPANNWVANIDNQSATSLTINSTDNSQVLALKLTGSSAPVVFNHSGTIIPSNGMRIGQGAVFILDGGSIQTCRIVEVDPNGLFIGSGQIKPQFETDGTPFRLKSTFTNSGNVDLAPSSGQPVELTTNSGFESGNGFPFQGIEGWENFGGDQTLNGRNTSNPFSGAYRGIVGRSANGAAVSPSHDTKQLIEESGIYQLSFRHAAASGWDIGSDQINAIVYYENQNADHVELFSVAVAPTVHFSNGYDFYTQQLPALDASSYGLTLRVRFESLAGNGEFASIDDVSLKNTGLPGTKQLLVSGEYHQSEHAQIEIMLESPGGIAGVDHEQLAIEGTARLNGILKLSLGPSYIPQAGDVFEIVSADLLIGQFSEIDLPTSNVSWDVFYTANSVFAIAEDAFLLGDINQDGTVNLLDVAPFVTIVSNGEFLAEADINRDGVVNLLDVHPFIQLLAG